MEVTGDEVELTVILAGQADTDLGRLEERTDLSVTDIVNRAITLYEFIDAQMRDGAEIVVRTADGTEKAVKLV